MSPYDYESGSDGDWDERGELAWNEFDWQQYLNRNHRDIERFLALYAKLRPQGDYLNEIARRMEWDHEEWSNLDAGFDEPLNDGIDASDPESEDYDPYTLEQHPVFIVTRGLYRDLRREWEKLMENPAGPISSGSVWKYAESLHTGEFNAILGVQALDMGDLALVVCHFKNALSAVNESLRILHLLADHKLNAIRGVAADARARLFDLREVWLRVMLDCREEIQRRFKGDE